MKVVNFFRPGKILSCRFMDGKCIAGVDFGTPVAIVLNPYHGEQVGEYIVMHDGGTFVKIDEEDAVRQIDEWDKANSQHE